MATMQADVSELNKEANTVEELVLRRGRGRPITQADVAAIRDGLTQGMSYVAIGQQIGRAGTIIRRYAERLKMPSPRAVLLASKQHRSPRKNTGGPIPSSEIPKRRGFYNCPECDKKYTEIRFVAKHRVSHGILGKSKSALQSRKSNHDSPDVNMSLDEARAKYNQHRIKTGKHVCPIQGCKKTYDSQNGMYYHLNHKHYPENKLATGKESNGSGQPVTQSVPSNGAAEPQGWTSEALTGFLFAHVHTNIQDVSQGDSKSQQSITLRLSELLQFEVLRKRQERARSLGVHSHLPAMRS